MQGLDYNETEVNELISRVDVDGDGWVDEEQLELIIEELNTGVTDTIIYKFPNRPEIIYIPLTPEDRLNFIHLN